MRKIRGSAVGVRSSAMFLCAMFSLFFRNAAAQTSPQSIAEATPQTKADSTGEWLEAIRDDGIIVYKRRRAGSAYEEVRAETVMTARTDDFFPFFNEPENYRKWVYGTIESRQVSRVSPTDFVFYGVFQIPWPFENRELFSRIEIQRDAQKKELQARLRHLASTLPTAAGLVRVVKFESLWRVKAVAEEKVDFSIEMYAEPGGNLPPFIVNLVLSRIQLWSMKNLRNQILKR
jgi:hypothetical protein